MINIRNANGTGSVYKLSGNRRNPYAVSITVKTEYDEKKDKYILKRKMLGYYPTQQAARKALALYNDNPYDPECIDITFAEIWNKVKPKMYAKLSKTRTDSYDSAYRYIKCADRKIKDIRTQDLQKCIDDCKHKSSTKQNIKTVMSRVYEYAMQNDFITKDYSEYVKFDRDPVEIKRKLFTNEEIKILWSNQGTWDIDLILVLLYTGMRINEFLALKSVYVNLDDKTISLPRDIVKNDSSERTIPIHDKLIPILQRFKDTRSEYIAVKPNGVRIQYKNYMGREIKELEQLLGERHTPHDTRHTFITRARECGCDNLVIQRIVGHTPDTITERIYTHLSMEELLKEINKVDYC